MTPSLELTHSKVETPMVASSSSRSSFWSRYLVLINFWLDACLLLLFLVQCWILTVLVAVFPRGELRATVWGQPFYVWLDALGSVMGVFALGIVLHVMLHWSWVCGTFVTRLCGRRAPRDDGTHTLIGVGLLVLLVHFLAAAVLAARVGLHVP
ncbi:MAG: hypothetical protein KatS3mg114_1426 [Planctomycetaceae bacterium]|nr:MAG: hypothetical protein KatS3mg114_1426 [Planctomycetaceae bacterium]